MDGDDFFYIAPTTCVVIMCRCENETNENFETLFVNLRSSSRDDWSAGESEAKISVDFDTSTSCDGKIYYWSCEEMKINKNTENVVNITRDHGSTVKSDQRNGASSSSLFDRSSHECCRECSRASEKETIVDDLVALDSLRKTSENHRRQRLTIDRSDGRGSSPALILIDKDNN